MLNSNWKALLASNKVQVGVKRKADGSTTTEAASKKASDTSSNSSKASASGVNEAGASANATLTPCLAIDCEFVGAGRDGSEDVLARVSLVNFHGECVYDRFVRPKDVVTDWRTAVSGIKPQHVQGKGALTFAQVQKEVAALIADKILVGHAVHNDLSALLLSHPKHLLRDTSKYKGLCPDRPRSLKKLAAEVLGLQIQSGAHNSVEDARATLMLYKHYRVKWEKELWDKKRKAKQTVVDEETTAAAAVSTSAAVAPAGDSPDPDSALHAGTIKKRKLTGSAALAAKQDARRAAKVERNQRRKQMRKEQKAAKNNR